MFPMHKRHICTTLLTVALASLPSLARADALAELHATQYHAAPWLIVASVGMGVEPHDGILDSSHSPIAFTLAGQALWHGWVGPAIGLYTSEGSPVVAMSGQPSFADRVSLVAALAVRPLAFLAWGRGDDFAGRLAAGVGVELGISEELTRDSLELSHALGLHALLSMELPIWGGASVGGLTLRAAGRLVYTDAQCFSPDAMASSAECFGLDATKHKVIVEPGTALQFLFGFVYYL